MRGMCEWVFSGAHEAAGVRGVGVGADHHEAREGVVLEHNLRRRNRGGREEGNQFPEPSTTGGKPRAPGACRGVFRHTRARGRCKKQQAAGTERKPSASRRPRGTNIAEAPRRGPPSLLPSGGAGRGARLVDDPAAGLPEADAELGAGRGEEVVHLKRKATPG